MGQFDIRALEIHDLRVLLAVHQTGGVTKAASRLDLNPSTVSYILQKARSIFEDPLFVKVGRRIFPTDRCSALIAEVKVVLEKFDRLATPQSFDPARSRARVVVSCNDLARCVILPRLVPSVRIQAPNLTIKVVESRVTGENQLVENRCDILIAPEAVSLNGIFQQRLFEDKYVCFVDPLRRRGAISYDEYVGAKHVALTFESRWRAYYTEELRAKGVSLDVALDFPDAGMVQHAIRGTDLIVTAPSGLLPLFQPHCAAVECPVALPRFSIFQFWTERTNVDPTFQWFRRMISHAANGCEAA